MLDTIDVVAVNLSDFEGEPIICEKDTVYQSQPLRVEFCDFADLVRRAKNPKWETTGTLGGSTAILTRC